MSESKALKLYFDKGLAYRLADLIQPHYPAFPANSFVQAVADQIEPLELKGRVAVIADELHKALPSNYPEAVTILLNIVGPENETEVGMFTNGYFLMPVATFVERYGLPDFDCSMKALYGITKRNTSEYAIRPFLNEHYDDSWKMLNIWIHDENPHVRRLVSEGTRPRLPWAKRMKALGGDPANNLSLLEPLLNDPSLYVRKSVANHINDLTKDYREVTLDWLRDWMSRKELAGERMEWIVRHGLRTLYTAQDPVVLKILHRLW